MRCFCRLFRQDWCWARSRGWAPKTHYLRPNRGEDMAIDIEKNRKITSIDRNQTCIQIGSIHNFKHFTLRFAIDSARGKETSKLRAIAATPLICSCSKLNLVRKQIRYGSICVCEIAEKQCRSIQKKSHSASLIDCTDVKPFRSRHRRRTSERVASEVKVKPPDSV